MNGSLPSEPSVNDENVLRGTVQRVTYYNPANGYAVLQVEVLGRSSPVTVVGNALNVKVGAQVMARGQYVDHPKFGRQLSAVAITETRPSTKEGIARYLGSGAIKGIGDKTAQRIIDEFGEDALDVILKTPEKVAKLPGVGKKKAHLLKEFLGAREGVEEVKRFLIENNISQGLAARIFERFGNRAIEILTRDPYVLARDLRGVGFLTADQIALKFGLAPTSPQRIKAGLYYALEKASDDGHTCLKETQLMEKAAALLGLTDEVGDLLHENIKALESDGLFVVYEGAYFLRHLAKAEEFVSDFVTRRLGERETPLLPPESVDRSLDEASQALGVSFSLEQRQAVHAAVRHRLMVITGGPGCGKTTIVRALAHTYKSAGKRLFLAAPTGRAAQRMSQVCDRPASTIHRLLKFDPLNRQFLFGLSNPLPADAVIIDEASMIDVALARDLFAAIPREATLILVGDKDQLPSVGPGRVFADLIAVPELKVVSLSRLFRRAEESAITSAAHLINGGIVPDIPEPDGVTKSDAYFLPRSDAEEAAQTIEKLLSEQLPRKFGFAPDEIHVLTPSNRGEVGAERLNERLQSRLNPSPHPDPEQEVISGPYKFRVGDRVCQRVNNYQIDDVGVFNGDLGTIHSIDKSQGAVWVEMWDGRLIKYTLTEISQLSLAYALTVHRSQGSEMPCVVLALHDSHYTLLDRQLLYTAVTRAKRLLVIVGSKRALGMATRRAAGRQRSTLLRARISQRLTEVSNY